MTPPGQRAAGTPVKVGYINLEGGRISSPKYREGAELAVSYVNDCLCGFGGHPVELVRRYMDGTPESSAACARELVNAGVSVVIRGSNTNSAEAEIFAAAGIPYVLAYGVGPDELTAPGLFSLTMQDGGGMAGLATYANSRGWKKVALLPLGTPNITQFFEQFSGPVYARAGLQHTLTYVPHEASDPAPQLAQAMSGNPDAILFHGDVRTCTSFLKAIVTLGVTAPVFLVGACANKAVLATAPENSLASTYFLSPVDLGDDSDDARTFAARLHARDPQADPHSIHLRMGYLPVVTLARILKGFTGQPTCGNMMNAIRSARNVPLPFGRGTVITCDGTAIPQLPSVCSPNTVLHKVQPDGTSTFVDVFNVAPLYAS
jgi:branched-chain amino acid transport system substrate-binding protein